MTAVIAATSCQYGVAFDDCQVSCAQAGDTCPDGLACVAGMCRANGATGACGSNSGSAGDVVLSETADTMVDQQLQIGCTNTDGTTPDQSWYRLFSLSAAGADGGFHVRKVTFGICKSVAGATTGSGSGSGSGIGNPVLEVKLGTYSGSVNDATIDLAKVTELGSASQEIPATEITELVDTVLSADVPADSNLVVELHNADYLHTNKQVLIGATANTQTKAPYLRSPICGFSDPSNSVSSNAHVILTVTGSPN